MYKLNFYGYAVGTIGRALVVVAAVGAWVIYNGATGEKGVGGVFSISTLLASLFLIAA